MSMVLSNRPLLITLAVYFLIELVDEILLASAGLIAAQYFDWGVLQTGAFLALLGVLVLPANFLISEAAGPLEDRTILIASEVVTVIGLLTILSYWGNYSVRGPLDGKGWTAKCGVSVPGDMRDPHACLVYHRDRSMSGVSSTCLKSH
jgi:hypothetical protein